RLRYMLVVLLILYLSHRRPPRSTLFPYTTLFDLASPAWSWLRGLVDAADHVERLLGMVGELVVQDALAALERVLEVHHLAFEAGELLRREEWLRQEAVQSPCAVDLSLVGARELFESEHGDHVPQFLVAGQGLAYLARHAVVALADQGRRQHLGLRAQGVESGVEPLAGAFAREHDQGGQVSEGVRDGGVREIVRRNVDRLHRRDGRSPRGADALLQFGQLRPQCWLVTHARR